MKEWFEKKLQNLRSDPVGDFENGDLLNDENTKRNATVFTTALCVVFIIIAAVIFYIKQPSVASEEQNIGQSPIDFGAVIEPDFTAKDNQSALSAQQLTISNLEKIVSDLNKTVQSQLKNNEEQKESFKEQMDQLESQYRQQIIGLEETWREKIDSMKAEQVELDESQTGAYSQTKSGRYFGENQTGYRDPLYGSSKNDDLYVHERPMGIPGQKSGIDHIALTWDSPDEERKRNIENYVPAGTMVTAIITGGADANAGVNGQSDTSPIIFQTMNDGLLPNGKASKLNNCTVTGAVYGEVSSSRGIVRTHRLSCIFKDDEIIDIPVEGTVFNFGRNGIRGNTVIRNGDIVQMAGLASILKGTGEAANLFTTTTSTSALGSTSTVKGEDALLNILGQSADSVGKTLSDYYVKLADQYHPFIELNPGNVVNIIFLKGFPLDAVGIAEYEQQLAQQQSNLPTPTAQIIENITNPLINQLPSGARPGMKSDSPSQQPLNSPSAFGIPK
ncbi:TraB/TrbI/VirB10 family type IV secretion system protein [Photobacterium sp. R1]